MTQIQNNTALPGALGGLGANNPAYAGRKEGSPDFARWLNQSSQQLQNQASLAQQSQQLSAQQLQTQQQAQQLQAQQLQNQQQAQRQQQAQPKPERPPEHNASDDENRLAARNAAARQGAGKTQDAKAPASPARKDAGQRADASDAADAADAAAKDTRAAADAGDAQDASRVDAKDGEGKDRKIAKEAKDGAATPAEQILAMLRGEAPAEAKPRAADGDGDAAGTDALPGGTQAHGKHPTTGDAMRERQELQRELSQAAAGKAGAAEGADKAAAQDSLQAVSGGAHEIAMGDGAAKGPQHSFEALLAAAQQAGTAPAAGGADAAAPAQAPSVPLSQPLDSPDFAPELSASVSLLIKDGVHEAQLQLNPTEMGPVSINIQLEGQQAQVNFHAQHAATREVLERSLPDLAAALQAQGLTLSGGGVFAQSQSSGGQNRGDGSPDGAANGSGRRGGRGSDDDGAIAATGRGERRAAPRGLVDLYA
jgi:flagellar hook-length control protein FliK